MASSSSEPILSFDRTKKRTRTKKKAISEKEIKNRKNTISEKETSLIDNNKIEKDGHDNDDERDLSYDDMLNMFYDRIHREHPEYNLKNKRIVVPPPRIALEGGKRTVWFNFNETSNALNRNIQHFKDYVVSELGTSGSIDAEHRLHIMGRPKQLQIQNVVSHYIRDYVACRMCKGYKTSYIKDNRLFYISCQDCGAKRSVESIKQGFVAQIVRKKE